MGKIRVGIVATGMMAQKHTDALRRIPDVTVVGIADPYVGNIKEIAERLGIPQGFSDYKEMCKELCIDVLHNCTPNSEHYVINKYAIENGIGIYSEKPLGISTEEAESLCRLLEENMVPNGVNFNYRSNAAVREMRARIRNGNAGTPLLVHGGYLQDWLMYETDYNWRIESDRGGKSRAVADIGSHWFDTAQLILGQKIKSVYARLLTVYPERKKPSRETGTFCKMKEGVEYDRIKVSSEDIGMIMVEFEGGVYGNVVLSQVSGGYKNDLKISVDCSGYSLRWAQEEADHILIGDREAGVVKMFSSSGDMTDDANKYAALPGGHPVGWADALCNNIGLFYEAIKNGTYKNEKQEYATFQDAAYIMKVVDACMRSSEENKWINVE